MQAGRVLQRADACNDNDEIERLHRELASFNQRIRELEGLHPESSKIEALKARALVVSREIDELRCRRATLDLAGLLSK